MANLTVEQPSIKVLKVEVTHGLDVERDSNGAEGDWSVSKSSMRGASLHTYKAKQGGPDWIDKLDYDYKPYRVAVTALIDSPMKLYVQNQNYSKILLGNDNDELAKNVIRFEANVGYTELFDILPTQNCPPRYWKITDYNNLMNENPDF